MSWATASVIAHEYPGALTEILAYGTAAGVSAARVVGQKHWISDAVIGSALGWYLGRQIYRARGERRYRSFELGDIHETLEDKTPDPGYMGTTYVPLDSWIYPALDRMEALGYLPKYVQAIRPLARMEAARLTLHLQETTRLSRGATARLRGWWASCDRNLRWNWLTWRARRMLAPSWSRCMRAPSRSWARRCDDSYHFAQTLYDDYGRPYGQGFNGILGASVRSEAGPLAFYVRGEFQHSASIAPYSPATAQAIANVDRASPELRSDVLRQNQFNTIEAYVALNMNNWEMSFGQQSLDVGT